MQEFLIFLLFISYASSEFCKGGLIKFGKCICPRGYRYIQEECVKRKTKITSPSRPCPYGYIRGPDGKCKRDPHTHVVRKPVIYLYPEESIDISLQLNIKESKFTTVYPKFNGKITWNVHAKPNGDILIKDKTYPYLFWEAESYIS